MPAVRALLGEASIPVFDAVASTHAGHESGEASSSFLAVFSGVTCRRRCGAETFFELRRSTLRKDENEEGSGKEEVWKR